VKLFFEDPDLDGQLQRTVAKCDCGMANPGECLTIAAAIEEGNRDSWYRAFFDFATGLQTKGANAEQAGHAVSARGYYLRACEYFRNAFFYHRDDLDSPELHAAYRASRDCFRAALPLLAHSITVHVVVGPDATYPGYLALPSSASAEPVPALIMPGGYDGTEEEFYPALVEAAARGYAAYCFDGPGQGGTLYEQRVVMRPDWENVIPAVFDAIASLPEVDDSKVAIMGRSFGGYLAPRAVAGEERFAALIADPGQYDLGAALTSRVPPPLLERIGEDSDEAEAAFQSMLEHEPMRRLFLPRMATHGCALLEYTNEGYAQQIHCPTLICDNETDIVSTGQGQLLADHLTCPTQFIRFTAAEGAEGHCEGMAGVVFYARAFDWLDATLAQRC
jgi:dienelactone hydrolase